MWIYILLVIYYVILLCYYIISYKCIILDGFFYYYIMRYLMFDHTKKHHIICTLTSTDRYIYIYTLLRFADSSTLDTTLLNTWNLGLHLQWRTSAEHVVKIETLQAGQGPCETSWDSRWRYWKQNTLLMHTNAYYTWLHLILMNAFIYMCIYIYNLLFNNEVLTLSKHGVLSDYARKHIMYNMYTYAHWDGSSRTRGN